jgi:hypothetical protein
VNLLASRGEHHCNRLLYSPGLQIPAQPMHITGMLLFISHYHFQLNRIIYRSVYRIIYRIINCSSKFYRLSLFNIVWFIVHQHLIVYRWSTSYRVSFVNIVWFIVLPRRIIYRSSSLFIKDVLLITILWFNVKYRMTYSALQVPSLSSFS